jgi:hypothetical protein
MDIEMNDPERKLPFTFWLSLAASGLLILSPFYEWVVDAHEPFAFSLLVAAIFVLFLAVLVSSLVYAMRWLRKDKRRALLPLSVNLLALLLFWLIPFTAIMLKLDFHLNYRKRMEVVSMVKSGQLKPNVTHNETLISLPPGYRHLSKGGGEIVVEDGTIFFYTFRGIGDHFSGFAYRSDDNPPGLLGNDIFAEEEKIQEHWYWAAS